MVAGVTTVLPPRIFTFALLLTLASYLIQKGKHQEARRVLARLHATEEAAFEFAQIETQVQIDSSLPHTWKSLVTKKSYRKRTLYAVGLACGIQFTGVLVVNSMVYLTS